MNILSSGSVIHKSEMGLTVKLENKAVSEVQRPHTKAVELAYERNQLAKKTRLSHPKADK